MPGRVRLCPLPCKENATSIRSVRQRTKSPIRAIRNGTAAPVGQGAFHSAGMDKVRFRSSPLARTLVVLAATIATTGTIPVASVALVLGIHRLMSEGLTPTNVVGNAVATIVVSKWEHALDEKRLRSELGGAA